VLKEIDVNLDAHELIKIRVFSDERKERDSMLRRICDDLDAATVQHVGKTLIVWRPAPKDEVALPRHAVPAGISAARKAPQARRPRTPLPRTPARPSPRGKTPVEIPSAPASRRRRVMTNSASTWEDGAGDRSPRGPKGAGVAKGAAPRSSRRAVPGGAYKKAARPAATPHGKSASSFVGASGARRRRRKAG
jgi:hypothetical protein